MLAPEASALNSRIRINLWLRRAPSPPQRMVVHVETTSTLAGLKTMIEESMGIPVAEQRVFSGGVELASNRTFEELGVQKDNTLFIVRIPEDIYRKTKGASDCRGTTLLN